MIRKLLGKEEFGAALVLVLSGAVVVLVSRGDGPTSPGQLVAGMLSNPVPRGAGTPHPSVRAGRAQVAA